MQRVLVVALPLLLLCPLVLAGPAPKKPAPLPAAGGKKDEGKEDGGKEDGGKKDGGKKDEGKKDEAVIPEGSGDYRKVLIEVVRYKKGAITFEQLKKFVVDAKLPPHPLGCGYVIAPVPAPPPGTPFNPALMPRDWEHTFGEVAMTYWAGKLTREEYDRLHEAAHREQPGYPNCGRTGPAR